MISFKFKVESQQVPNAKKDSFDFKKAEFESINNYLSKNDWTTLFNKLISLQHFYDQFISLIQTSIKRFIPIYFINNIRTKYPSHIEKLLKKNLFCTKKSKTNKYFLKIIKISHKNIN